MTEPTDDTPRTEAEHAAIRDALRERVAQLQQANVDKYQQMRAQGVQPNPVEMVLLRLNTLLDVALHPDERLQFDLAFETRVAEAFDSLLSQIAQAKLMQGVPPGGMPPGGSNGGGRLILPGQ